MDRERRATAGRRMTALVGKAQEDDDAFWGHDTWNENDDDDDDGNDSFRSSDEDSDLKRDEFDSDFDASENEENENAMDDERGRREEELLNLEERQQRGKKAAASSTSSYRDVASKASRAMAMRKQTGRQSVTGRGLNAGIVLNLPPASPGGAAAPVVGTSQHAAAATAPTSKPGLPPTTTMSIARTKARRAITKPKRRAAKAAARQLSSTLSSSAPSAARHAPHETALMSSSAATTTTTASTGASSPTSHKAKKRRFDPSTTGGGGGRKITQEQMILEAVHETEPANERWRLARERRMQDSDLQQQQQQQQQLTGRGDGSSRHKNATIVEKFVSRRGYLNVISFPEMDHVPPILQQPQHHDGQQRPRRGQGPSSTRPKPVCVISGKPARYRDPKTGHAYLDAEAFRELRRRHGAGEPVVPSAAPRPSSNGIDVDGAPKAIAAEPTGATSTADDAAPPTTGNGAARATASAVHESKGAAKSNSSSSSLSSSSSPLRIHIRASSVLASLHPSTAITAPPESKTVPSAASSSAPANMSLTVPRAPGDTLQTTSPATNTTTQQLTIPPMPAQAVVSTATSQAAVAAVTNPATAGGPGIEATATETATSAKISPAKNSVPANGSPALVASLQISLPPKVPIPSRQTPVCDGLSTPPPAAPPLPATGYALHSHPATAPPSPLPGSTGLAVRASPRQRKPTAKVRHFSP